MIISKDTLFKALIVLTIIVAGFPVWSLKILGTIVFVLLSIFLWHVGTKKILPCIDWDDYFHRNMAILVVIFFGSFTAVITSALCDSVGIWYGKIAMIILILTIAIAIVHVIIKTWGNKIVTAMLILFLAFLIWAIVSISSI